MCFFVIQSLHTKGMLTALILVNKSIMLIHVSLSNNVLM